MVKAIRTTGQTGDTWVIDYLPGGHDARLVAGPCVFSEAIDHATSHRQLLADRPDLYPDRSTDVVTGRDLQNYHLTRDGRRTAGHMNPTRYVGKASVKRVRINQGGYDDTGYYWGNGEPLYRIEHVDADSADETTVFHYRTYDRDDAKATHSERFPDVTYYR